MVEVVHRVDAHKDVVIAEFTGNFAEIPWMDIFNSAIEIAKTLLEHLVSNRRHQIQVNLKIR